MKNLITLIFTALLFVSTVSSAADIFKEFGLNPKFAKAFPKELKGHDQYDPAIYLLSVNLGVLTELQFSQLNAYFKNQSSITYSANRAYKLEEFLPAAMQALLNKKIDDEYYDQDYLMSNKASWPLEFDKEGAFSGANCHGTALEMSRVIGMQGGKGKYVVYAPINFEVNALIANRKIFSPISTNDLKFGDIVAFINEEHASDDPDPNHNVQHTAIYITNNIFFEKRDLAEEEPIRLVFLEDMQKRLKLAVDPKFTTNFLRITGDFNALALDSNWSTSDYWNRYPKGLSKSEIKSTQKVLSNHFDSMHIGVSDQTELGPVYSLVLGEPMNIVDVPNQKPSIQEKSKVKRIRSFVGY